MRHHIQLQLLDRLRTSESLSFSELKPQGIENKLFNYHLKALMREGYVEKLESGYKLSTEGQYLWRRIREKPTQLAKRAFSVLYLAVYSEEKGWLLYRRNTHPAKNKVAFMHAIPVFDEAVDQTATRVMYEKTSLKGDFSVHASGFFHTTRDGEYDGFTNFTLLYCNNPEGILTVSDADAEYFWDKNPMSFDTDLLPNMPVLIDVLNDTKHIFIDSTVTY